MRRTEQGSGANWRWGLVVGVALLAWTASPAKGTLYYCPDRPPDRQYSAQAEPGCVPLVQEDRRRSDRRAPRSGATAPPDISNLQVAVDQFLERYNRLVSCCATDHRRISDVDALAGEANRLLQAITGAMAGEAIKLRGFTFRALIDPIATARRNLDALADRLEALQNLELQRSRVPYEEKARIRRRISDIEDDISTRFRPISLTGSSRTGAGAQDTTLPTRIGPSSDTTLPVTEGTAPASTSGDAGSLGARTGAGIGKEAASGTNIGQTPATGFGIGGNQGPTGQSSLPTRAGPDIGN